MSENVANNVAQREMQDLTERWKNGELDVLFDVYVKIPDEGVRNRKIYYLNQYLGTKLSDEIEIFAPVPTYDQFVELTEKANQFSQTVKKVEELQKKLYIATKALRELKPQLESQDDWLIVVRALKEIDEVSK